MAPRDDDSHPTFYVRDTSAMDTTLEANAMRYRLMPTLQHMAVVKMAASLWTGQHIKYKASQCLESTTDLKLNLKELSLILQDEVDKLPFPDRFIRLLKNIVQNLGIEVLRWIKFQVNFDPLLKLLDYLHCIQWTSRGRIDQKGTAQLIISQDGVSEVYKAKVTNFYYLEPNSELILEDVLVTHSDMCSKFSKVLSEDIEDNFDYTFSCVIPYIPSIKTQYDEYSDSVSEGEDYIVAINERHKKRKIEIDPKLYKNLIIYNEPLLRRLWDTFNERTKSRLLNEGFHKCQNADVMCFLLSQMSEQQQIKVLSTDSEYILLNLFTDWLWQDYLIPTLWHYFDIINGAGYVVLLKRMVHGIKCHLQYNKCQTILIEMLEGAPRHLKEPILSSEFSLFFIEEIFSELFEMEHLDIVKKLLTFVKSFKEIVSINRFITELAIIHIDFYMVDQCSLFELSFNTLLESQERREDFFMECGLEICLHAFYEAKFVMTGIMINVFLHSQDKIDNFKRALVEQSCLLKLIYRYLFRGDYERADQILSFCFSGELESIERFKRTQLFLLTQGPFSETNERLLHFLVRKKDRLRSLKKCLRWCCANDDDIDVFKRQLLQNAGAARICWNLLIFKRFILADQFLRWCFSSEEDKVRLFKQGFALSAASHGINSTYNSRFGNRCSYGRSDATRFVQWLGLSLEAIQTFKGDYLRNPATNIYDENICYALCQQEISLEGKYFME